MKITPRVSPFLAWGDFHARSRFARPTIPEEKWGTIRSLVFFSKGINPKWGSLASTRFKFGKCDYGFPVVAVIKLLPLILFQTILSRAGCVTEARNLYLSRFGHDSWSCDPYRPCQNIWRAVTLASFGDSIYLDGTNTDQDPYTCQSQTSEYPGIYIYKSLSLIGYGNSMAQIRCSEGTGLIFNGSYEGEQMNVTISRLSVNQSFVRFEDSSVLIDGCKFQASKQGVTFVIRQKRSSSIHFANSTFSKNKQCISVVVSRGKTTSQDVEVIFKMTNSLFDGNFSSDDGGCISFTDSPNTNKSLISNIILENVTFSRNRFSSRGLIFVQVDNSTQNVNLLNVTFIDNSPSSDRDVERSNGYSECVFRSTTVNIFVSASNFTSYSTRLFNVSASNISLHIYDSTFSGHRVKGKGGVISLNGTKICKLSVSGSSFFNTSASQGGAINTECTNMYSASFEDSVFISNTAWNKVGGAVYIHSRVFDSDDADFSNVKAHLDYSFQDEQLLQIDCNKCKFIDSWGSALYIVTRRASLRLIQTQFTNCFAMKGGGVYMQTGSMLPKRKRSSDNADLLLTVASSNFTGCMANVFGGSLYVEYETAMQLSINNSHFISNSAEWGFGGVLWAGSLTTDDRSLKRNPSQIQIEFSTFSSNRARQGGALFLMMNSESNLILQEVVMESNAAVERFGGAAVIYNCTVKVQKSQFLSNFAGSYGGVFWMADEMHNFKVIDSLFDSNAALNYKGGAFQIQTRSAVLSVLIINSTFQNCSAQAGAGAISIESDQNITVVVKRSRFLRNRSYIFGDGGALYFSMWPDVQKDPGCTKKRSSSDTQNNVKNYPSWIYKSLLTIEDTTFERNGARTGGAVLLSNGKATFRNCYFVDNFAAIRGGHIYTLDGSASLIIEGSVFRQTMKELQLPTTKYTQGSFVHTESSGALMLHQSTLDSRTYGSADPLMQVRNGRVIDVGNNNLTTFHCPVGSQMEILYFTDQVTAQINEIPCVIEVSTLVLSCSACGENSYSLQRGRALGSRLAPGFQCLSCPFGANCSKNIVAKPNFWGSEEKIFPPTLKFTLCPLGYCRPPQETDFPEYNGCQGNRSGELCGQCNETYTETLYSTNCRPSRECKDYWFWPVILVYVSLMAFYFTFKPPVVSWIRLQILWFKEHEPANQAENNFDRGYLKILFYFYQATNLLLVSNSSKHILETKFIDPLIGLFNFQQSFSSNGLICPFPGLTSITKQLFSACYVFATLLVIGAFYIFHWVVQRLRGQESPAAGPYFGGVLQTMLLGYTTLASSSFNLLRCVPIGSEQRLFYDGNIVCFQWWQYILVAFICTFVVPFVFVLLWGSFKIYNRTLSVGKFLLVCSFPLPSLLYLSYISLFCTARNAASEDSSPSQESRRSVERVLYDCFKNPENGSKLSLSWESVMIGRRLILICFSSLVSDPMPRLLIMSFFCVLFLQHHSMTWPFRDGIANVVETISLVFIVLLGMMNAYFASFLSLAVPTNDHFTSWWNVFEKVEIIILCAVPAFFGLLLVAALSSQIFRLTVVVCRTLYHLCWVCFIWCSSRRNDGMTPLLT